MLEEMSVLASSPPRASVSPTKTGGEERPGSVSVPTKILWRDVRGKSMLLMNYPGMPASPSKSLTGSKVSGREPALLCTGPVLGRGLVPHGGMAEAAERRLEG